MKRKYAKIILVSKNNELVAISSDEISFGTDNAYLTDDSKRDPNHDWNENCMSFLTSTGALQHWVLFIKTVSIKNLE